MKYFKLFLIMVVGMFAWSLPANAQDARPADDASPVNRRDGRRPNLLAELGLSREQIQQIRRLNQARRPAMMDAQQKMRDANRNLDAAIYGEAISESEFRLKLAEFHAAQTELARLRFESELSVRKVLTPEQLIRFRELRNRVVERRGKTLERRRDRNILRPRPDREPLPEPPSND